MDNAEKMAADIALAMNGGEWKDGKWYSKGHREAWIKAVQPYADEIERLRKEYLSIEKQLGETQVRCSEIGEHLLGEIERLREALKEAHHQLDYWQKMALLKTSEPAIQQKDSE